MLSSYILQLLCRARWTFSTGQKKAYDWRYGRRTMLTTVSLRNRLLTLSHYCYLGWWANMGLSAAYGWGIDWLWTLKKTQFESNKFWKIEAIFDLIHWEKYSSALWLKNEGVVSKETVVLRRWGSSIQKFGFINGVDNVNWPPYRDSKS